MRDEDQSEEAQLRRRTLLYGSCGFTAGLIWVVCQELSAEERIKLKSTPLPVKLSDFFSSTNVKLPNECGNPYSLR